MKGVIEHQVDTSGLNGMRGFAGPPAPGTPGKSYSLKNRCRIVKGKCGFPIISAINFYGSYKGGNGAQVSSCPPNTYVNG